jgi:hypothetical protein
MLTIFRVIAFEKFTAVFFFFYLIAVLSIGFILSAIHWSAAVIIVLLGVGLFLKILKSFQFLKRALIRKGDRIEYADPHASEATQVFKKAVILLKMRPEEVKKTKLISPELMEDNRHFYLVEADKKPSVIAYDWIIGISPEMLETDEDD